MPIFNNNQLHHRQYGQRILFKRDDQGATVYPWIDLGVITQPSAPTFEPTVIDVRDPYQGNGLVGSAVTQLDETYTVKTINLSMQNQSLYFLADQPTALSQAATPQVDVPSTEIVGRADGGGFVKIKDVGGVKIYKITTIDAVKEAPATALTLGTDYVEDDLTVGLYRLLAGGPAGFTEGQAVSILTSFTPEAQTGLRIINPQSQPIIEGEAIILARECPDFDSARECRASLAPAAGNFQAADLSDLDFTLRVLTSTGSTACSETFGRLIQFGGAVPTNVPA